MPSVSNPIQRALAGENGRRLVRRAQAAGGSQGEEAMTEEVAVSVRLSPAEIEALDEWRKAQLIIPSRSKAIGGLIKIALMAEKKKKNG
jgi:hypothetical protein